MIIHVEDVRIEGDFATANLYRDDEDTGLKYQFYFEGGQWKLNLTSVIVMSNLLMKQQFEKLGYEDEDKYIFDMLEAVSGKKVNNGIFNPLIRK